MLVSFQSFFPSKCGRLYVLAAPHAGGGGALYLSSDKSASPVDVEKSLKAAAKTFGTISNAGGTRPITREDVGGF